MEQGRFQATSLFNLETLIAVMFRRALPSLRPLGTARRCLSTPQLHRAINRPVQYSLQNTPRTPAFSTSAISFASQRELVVKHLRKDLGPGESLSSPLTCPRLTCSKDYAKQTLPASLVLSTLRDMRIERSLNNHPESESSCSLPSNPYSNN